MAFNFSESIFGGIGDERSGMTYTVRNHSLGKPAGIRISVYGSDDACAVSSMKLGREFFLTSSGQFLFLNC